MKDSLAWDYISERVKEEAEYILGTGATVRACALHFNISKSTVHKDVTERLKEIDSRLYEGVRKVLDKNLSERHIRGGMATRNKYRACSCGGSCNNCRCGANPPRQNITQNFNRKLRS